MIIVKKGKAMRALGIVLIVAGVVMMIITGVNIVEQNKVIDLGRVEVTTEETRPVTWSPVVGTVLLIAGVIVLMSGTTEKRPAT